MLIHLRMKDSKISKLQNSFIYLFMASSKTQSWVKEVKGGLVRFIVWHFPVPVGISLSLTLTLLPILVEEETWAGGYSAVSVTPDCRRTRLRTTSPGMRREEAWFSAHAQAFGDSGCEESAVSLNVKHGSLAGGKNWFENRSVTKNYATVWFT